MANNTRNHLAPSIQAVALRVVKNEARHNERGVIEREDGRRQAVAVVAVRLCDTGIERRITLDRVTLLVSNPLGHHEQVTPMLQGQSGIAGTAATLHLRSVVTLAGSVGVGA